MTRDQIIIKYLPYIHTAVARFVRTNKLKDPDEIFSYARYQLTLIAEHMVGLPDDDKIRYLIVSIRRRLREYSDRLRTSEELADHSYENRCEELMVDILDICSPLEREVILLRSEGQTYLAIGDKLGITARNAFDMVKIIRGRL